MKNLQRLFLTAFAVSVRLSASAVLLEVESGTATFSSNISGSIRKTGAGILMLTGINALTSLDIEEGTVLVCNKANLNNFGMDIPITLSKLHPQAKAVIFHSLAYILMLLFATANVF